MRRRAADRFPQVRFADALEPLSIVDGETVRSPSLRFYEARREAGEFERMHATVLTSPVIAFVDEFTNNGYDGLKAAAQLKLPRIEATAHERRRWVDSVLGHPIVHEYLRRRQNLDFVGRRVTKERLILELERIALSNLADYVALDTEGRVAFSFDTRDREIMSAVSELTTKRARGRSVLDETKLKFHDKVDAIKELLRRYEVEEKVVSLTEGFPSSLFPGSGQPGGASDAPALEIRILPVPSGAFIPAPMPPHERQSGGNPTLD